MPVTVDRSPATCRNGDNSDHSGDRLRQNGEKATIQNGDNEIQVYTFTVSRPEKFDLGIIT